MYSGGILFLFNTGVAACSLYWCRVQGVTVAGT